MKLEKQELLFFVVVVVCLLEMEHKYILILFRFIMGYFGHFGLSVTCVWISIYNQRIYIYNWKNRHDSNDNNDKIYHFLKRIILYLLNLRR